MVESSDVEVSSLAESVQAVEKVLSDPVKAAQIGYLARALLLNTKGRLESLKHEQAESREHAKEEERLTRDSIAVAQMVERESKLNSDEKHEYGGLLKSEYFTKASFGTLEHFYAKSFDKLSEQGKDEISHRVWEGIRHGEYTFAELPEVVQEKEAKRVYEKVKANDAAVANIPPQDRADLVRAYESGNHQAVTETLSRQNFSDNLYCQRGVALRATPVEKKVEGKALDDGIASAEKVATTSIKPGAVAMSDDNAMAMTDLPRPTGAANPIQR